MNKSFISFGVYQIPPTVEFLIKSKDYFGIFIEPHLHEVLKLQEYLKEKTVSPDRYFILQNVVSHNNSVVEYAFTSLDEGTGANCLTGYKSSNVTYNYAVSMVPLTLDQIVAISNFPVQHIRMNCEGAELKILETYSFECKPETLFVETHEHLVPGGTELIMALMAKKGYTVLHEVF